MELTINEIREKQKILEKDLLTKINTFEVDTGIKVGEIIYGYNKEKKKPWISLNYSNPFM